MFGGYAVFCHVWLILYCLCFSYEETWHDTYIIRSGPMSMCCRGDFFMYSVFNVVGGGWAAAAYSRGALPWHIAAGYACKVTQNPCRLIDCEGRM